MQPFIPVEIVDIIADFHDFDKYCKPQHKNNMIEVHNDIIMMDSIMPDDITPSIVWSCWGFGAKNLLEIEENYFNNLDITFDDDLSEIHTELDDDFSEIDYLEDEFSEITINDESLQDVNSFMDDDDYTLNESNDEDTINSIDDEDSIISFISD